MSVNRSDTTDEKSPPDSTRHDGNSQPENEQSGDKPAPKSSSRKKPTKEDRLAEALRSNLRRRKQAGRRNED
ncbi:hypothetical protein [Aquisalinus flavus]|uniref:hypothetical protein n=1 Tax=Aquisalinus flavus TaxID=1526572 RepID=UPI00165FFAD2|nr:hypothetical protein [Aquisalinus flavus]MBD0427385.1 hypothetical protein [Aquisalinus flavus]UNE47189.1 hypothetical protein FF099_03520 [Aquisalinus flavus]